MVTRTREAGPFAQLCQLYYLPGIGRIDDFSTGFDFWGGVGNWVGAGTRIGAGDGCSVLAAGVADGRSMVEVEAAGDGPPQAVKRPAIRSQD